MTNGKWIADGLIIRTDGIATTLIAQVIAPHPTPEDYSNARVMAKSKEMFELLKICRAIFHASFSNGKIKGEILSKIDDLIERVKE